MDYSCLHHMGGKKQRFYFKLTMEVCPFQRWCTAVKEYQVTDLENCPNFKPKQ